jgi:hypothetical protein
MKKLRVKTLIQTFPALLAAVGLLFLAGNINAGSSKSKCDKPKPAKPCPPPKKPKCKPAKPPRPSATSYGGQAVVLYFTNLLGTVILGDTGPLPSAGGAIEVSVCETNIPDTLHLDIGQASTEGSGRQSESDVSLSGLEVRLVTGGGQSFILKVDQLSVHAEARCTRHGPQFTGTTTITGLTIDDAAVEVTGQANQVVEFGGGTLTINYQAGVSAANQADITVAGLVVDVKDCGIGSIGLVHADILCGTNHVSGDCSDRVTGGGFIFGTPSGERANFGVGGGIQNGRLWGHLNYIDHGTGMHVKATEVTDYQVLDEITRQINYNVTIDGEAGMATVIVADKGEPGRNDIFMIQLSTGYMAGGDLGGAHPGGGNIQLHKPKCKDGKGHEGDDDHNGGNGNGHHGDCKDHNCKGGKDCKGGNGDNDDDQECDGHHHDKDCKDHDCKGNGDCKDKGGKGGNGGKGDKSGNGGKGGNHGKGGNNGKGGKEKCD